MNKEGKTVKDSETVMTEIVFPNDANPMGFLNGGKLMHWMDTASAICAQTHAESICVTASVDSVSFKRPVKVGDIVTINAKATRAFNSSIEILVEAWARKVKSSDTYLTNRAYFTFVAIGDNEKPCLVAPLLPKTAEEKKQFANALKRKKSRLHEK